MRTLIRFRIVIEVHGLYASVVFDVKERNDGEEEAVEETLQRLEHVE